MSRIQYNIRLIVNNDQKTTAGMLFLLTQDTANLPLARALVSLLFLYIHCTL